MYTYYIKLCFRYFWNDCWFIFYITILIILSLSLIAKEFNEEERLQLIRYHKFIGKSALICAIVTYLSGLLLIFKLHIFSLGVKFGALSLITLLLTSLYYTYKNAKIKTIGNHALWGHFSVIYPMQSIFIGFMFYKLLDYFQLEIIQMISNSLRIILGSILGSLYAIININTLISYAMITTGQNDGPGAKIKVKKAMISWKLVAYIFIAPLSIIIGEIVGSH